MSIEYWVPRSSVNAYWRSNSCFDFPSTQSRRRSRWMNIAFQTPSSTSCKRSTTSISNMLKPNTESLSENAFWESQMTTTVTFQKKTLTVHGTRESWSRSLFTAAPLTGWLFSYTVQFHSIRHPLWHVTNLTKFQFVKLVGDMWHAEIFRQAEAALSPEVPKA